jgi:hypothetical protein
VLGADADETPPFSFPSDQQPFDDFAVLRIDYCGFKQDGTLTVRRNDGWSADYQRTDGPVEENVHAIWSKGTEEMEMTPRLEADLAPPEVFVKRDDVVERYERIRGAVSTSRT